MRSYGPKALDRVLPVLRCGKFVGFGLLMLRCGDPLFTPTRILHLLRDFLPRAGQQPADQQGQAASTEAPLQGGSGDPAGDPEQRRQAARDEERKLHSDQEMFSCTTLSNRMGRDYYIRSDGCMDYGFNRCGVWEVWRSVVRLRRWHENLSGQSNQIPAFDS